MTKFEIRTDTFQLRFGRSLASIPAMSAGDVLNAYMALSNAEPETVASCDTLAEAQAELAKLGDYGRTYPEQAGSCYILRGQLAWIERSDYDEDGDWVSGGEIYDFAADPFEPEEED